MSNAHNIWIIITIMSGPGLVNDQPSAPVILNLLAPICVRQLRMACASARRAKPPHLVWYKARVARESLILQTPVYVICKTQSVYAAHNLRWPHKLTLMRAMYARQVSCAQINIAGNAASRATVSRTTRAHATRALTYLWCARATHIQLLERVCVACVRHVDGSIKRVNGDCSLNAR